MASELASLLASGDGGTSISSQGFGAVSSTKADDDVDNNDNIGRVYTDHPQHMTLARRMARKLSQYHWYHPLRHDDDGVEGGAVIGDPVDQCVPGLAKFFGCHLLGFLCCIAAKSAV